MTINCIVKSNFLKIPSYPSKQFLIAANALKISMHSKKKYEFKGKQ